MSDEHLRVWTTKDGTKLRWYQMTPSHLRNAAAMLKRAAWSDMGEGYCALSMLQGEMALYYAERDIDRSYEDKMQMAEDMEAYADRRESR
jgi:hypothetical protein